MIGSDPTSVDTDTDRRGSKFVRGPLKYFRNVDKSLAWFRLADGMLCIVQLDVKVDVARAAGRSWSKSGRLLLSKSAR
jgi:hypothetical protein